MNEPATIPALSQALRHVRMSGVFYCPSILTEPWGLELPPMEHCLWFHVISSGSCTLAVNDGPTVQLGVGDVAVVTRGEGHRFWGTEPAPTPSVFDLPHDEMSDTYAVLRHGGGGRRTDAVCGGVRFDLPSTRHLVDALPPLIHITRDDVPRADWMRATLDVIADETRSVRPGGDAIISRLCDIVVLQAIRTWIERDPGAQTGWLGALHDAQIGTAIAAIHADPAHEWSVTRLADQVAMSRSAFAARFSDLVGESAMRYVTRWRMYRALDLLETGNGTVAAVGRQVGYDSEAAFSRAFKRVMGVAPRAAARD